MRILHVLNSNKFSGAENVVCQIIEMFKDEKDIEMAYASPDGEIRNVLAEKEIEFYPMNKLCIRELKKVIGCFNPDIIHGHDFRGSIYASFFANHFKCISHLHINAPWMKKLTIKSMMYFLTCAKYEKILCVSNSVIEEFIFSPLVNSKMVSIGNPISTRSIRLKASQMQGTSSYDIVFLGRLNAVKNPMLFMEIVKDIIENNCDIKVAIIGDGELRPQIEAFIDENNLQNVVDLLGFQKNPYCILNCSKVLCMPSMWEGFGLAAVEALTLGVPVVCSKVGGLVELVDSSCGLLCTSKEEFVNEIRSLVTNNAYYSIKSKNALKRSKELENLEKYKRNLAGVYSVHTRCSNVENTYM